jgi:hypothetical protein
VDGNDTSGDRASLHHGSSQARQGNLQALAGSHLQATLARAALPRVGEVTQLSEEAIKLVVDTAVEKAVARIMESFGFEDDERKELKADFSHLRKWRKSVEQAQSYTFKLVVTTIIGGFLGAVWMGFKVMLGK